MPDYYWLIGNKVLPTDLQGWAEWRTRNEKHLYRHIINGYYISTVFIGMNMNMWDDGGEPPIVFETMIFHNKKDVFTLRASSRFGAARCHVIALKWVKSR